MRPLAILISLLLFLTIPSACSGGGSDNSNGNGNDDNSNGDDNDRDRDSDNDTPPGAPTSLAAVANGSSVIDLSWEAPASDGGSAITGYRIDFRKEGAADYSSAEVDTGKTDTDYSHAGLTAATSYGYRVYAINAIGTSPASNEATATTTRLAADLKPGAPTNLAATPGVDQVTLSWTAPIYCGSGNACSDTTHQHWLEYKLTSASDDGWANGAVVASGDAHAAMRTVTGLVGGMSYDFRLAVQLTGADDRGPWAEISAEPQMDSDSDGVFDGADAFPADSCASVDSDGDGAPDTILAPGSTAPGGSAACSAASTLAVDAFPDDACASVDGDGDGAPDTILAPGDSDMDSCTTASLLAVDAFPDDACASVDGDGNGKPDTIIAPGDSDTDACTAASPLTPDEDGDGDGVIDNLDVDDDNDGLIEIATRAELENMAHNLAGSSYDDEEADTGIGTGDTGDASGAPRAATADCTAASGTDTEGEDIFLCGYELTSDIDLEGSTSATSDDPPDISCDSGAWTPIGDCGSDGNCGEADSNDDDPFTAILEGNGFTISNLCIEGDGDTGDHDVLGLFGHLGGATVRNLTIAGLYIEASFTGGDTGTNDDNSRLGALVGYVTGDTVILNVAAEDSDSNIDLQGATTSDDQYIGGLLGGRTGGSITASYVTGAVAGGTGARDSVGGLVGWQTGGSIRASYATGAVDGGAGGSDSVGGLLGGRTGGGITASYATGAVDGGDGGTDSVGGLVGWQIGGSITASYATGTVDGGNGANDRVGGLVGIFQVKGSIRASYATGAVAGGYGDSDEVGGLVGAQNAGSIRASYATGAVDGGDGDSDEVGGLVGEQTGGSITTSYSFGVATGEIAGEVGTAKPGGVSSAADLTSGAYDATDPNSTSAGDEWDAAVWDFGDSSQSPALLYVDGYSSGAYSCAAASFPASLSVTCGTTLLPGQGR